jgi:hypothetical protein
MILWGAENIKTNTPSDKFDSMKIIEKRIRYLLGARLRNKNLMQNALKIQHRIRANHPLSNKWDSVLEIRKWRGIR